jgi:hypothetical protein
MKKIQSKYIYLFLLLFNKNFSLKVIARALIPNTQLGFQRRPARDDIK